MKNTTCTVMHSVDIMLFFQVSLVDLKWLMNTSTPLVAASKQLQTLIQIGSRSASLLPSLMFINVKYILTFRATPAEIVLS